jgi:hypothetical protein
MCLGIGNSYERWEDFADKNEQMGEFNNTRRVRRMIF